MSGVVYAKPGYVAPEVANGVSGDHLVDVYALAVILWELCAGRRFLNGDSGEHMSAVGDNRRPLPPIAGSIGAPAELDAVLARMGAFDREQRLANARLCRTELLALLTSAPFVQGAERGLRPRVSALLTSLYPTEPARSRAEFAKLVKEARALLRPKTPEPAPARTAPLLAAAGVAARDADPASDDKTRLPGTSYRLVKQLGAGAGGEVHEGVHVDLGRRVAVKILAQGLAGDEAHVARFRREARAIAKVSHPATARLYDYGQSSDGRTFLAMELWEGDTLDLVAGPAGNLSLDDALRIARDAALALHAVHLAGLVHRDVKPSNLLLTRDGQVKLLDFGLACVAGHGDDEELAPSGVCGTPAYLAPEQARQSKVDGRADVYALGSVLYELLTGRQPFSGSTIEAVLAQKREGLPENPSDRSPSKRLPAKVDALVLTALAVFPDDRYASALAFAGAIDEAARSLDHQAGRRRKTARGLFVAAMVSSIALLGVYGKGAYQKQVDVRTAEIAAFTMPTPRPPQFSPDEGDKLPLADPASAHGPVAPADPRSSPVASLAGADPVQAEETSAASGDAKQLRRKARRALRKHRYEDAKHLAEAWLRTDGSTDARLTLARAQIQLGESDAAKETLQAVLSVDPTADDARGLLRDLDAGKKPGSRRRLASLSKE